MNTSAQDATVRFKTPLPPGMMPNIPDVIIERELGRGGMGVVYQGRQTYLDRQVAVKLLLGAADGDFVKRFQREAKILAGLAHPHIVACHHAGLTTQGEPYLVMEFVDGPNLRTWIDEHGPLPTAAVLRLGQELAQALGHAHEAGIIHRDVKPENVLLARDPKVAADASFPFIAKLTDLGLARPAAATGDMNLTRQGMVLGTPATMAPEQLDNPEGVDFRADIYGLGCVLFHALTGRAAYQGTTVQQIITSKITGPVPKATSVLGHLPPSLDALLSRLMAKNRDERPATWAEVGTAIAAVPLAVAKPSFLRRWGGLIIILALGLSCGSVVAIVGHDSPKSETPAVVPTITAPQLIPSAAPSPTPKLAVPAATPTLAPEQLTWGTDEPAWPFDTARRLEGWTITTGAKWTAADEVDNALAGIAGMIERPLPALPCRMVGQLRLSTTPKHLTDRLMIGVRGQDGVVTGFTVYNFGEIFHLQIVRIDPVTQVPLVVIGPQTIKPAANLSVSLVVSAHHLIATAAGQPAIKADLLSTPTHVVLIADPAGAPGIVADLHFNRTTP